MPDVPKYPDYDAKRNELFPGKENWNLEYDQRAQLRDAMAVPEAEFKAAKEIWQRYYTMVGNTNATFSVARNPNAEVTATHESTRVMTKREFEQQNRYRGWGDSGSPIAQDKWEVMVPQGDESPALLAASYMMFTEHGSDASHLMKYVDNESLPVFYASLESARVAVMAGQWYHRDDEVRNALGNQMRNLINQHGYSSDVLAPFMAVRAQAWSVSPWEVTSPEQSDAAIFAQGFASEIERAVHYADDSIVLDVATQLAAQYEVLFTSTPVIDDPMAPSDDTGDSSGEGEDGNGGGGAYDGDEDEPSEEEEREVVEASEGDEDSADDDGQESPSQWTQPLQPPSTAPVMQPLPPSLIDVQANIAKDLRAAKGKAKGQVTRVQNKLKGVEDNIGTVQVSYAGDHLLNIYPAPAQEKIESEAISLDIQQSRGIVNHTRKYVGEPSQKTWELSFGNTKVFTRGANTRGRVGILIDISGSMGCGCNACTHASPSSPDSAAALAYAAAKVIAELDNDAIVAAYCGFDEIYRLKPGHALTHGAYKQTGGATPTCAALEWLEKSMGGELEVAACVLITDGHPSACGASKGPTEHTSEIAHRMYNAGMRFGCVVVRANQSVAKHLPQPVTVVVNKRSELGNIQNIIDSIGGNL